MSKQRPVISLVLQFSEITRYASDWKHRSLRKDAWTKLNFLLSLVKHMP
jgi:hypothetical protein